MRSFSFRLSTSHSRLSLWAFLLLVAAGKLQAQTLLVDKFSTHSSLNTALWSTGTPLLKTVASQLSSAWVEPVITFSSSGMAMSGVNGTYQFTGIQSNQYLAPPFTATATVMGSVANGDTFELFLANADVSRYVVVDGNLNPSSGYPGIWLTARLNNTGTPSGVVIYPTPALDTWYTITLAVDATGDTNVALTGATGATLVSKSVSGLGSGPFYVLLAQREGLPYTIGPNMAVWSQIQVLSGAGAAGPAINPGGVVNVASYATGAVAPGSIAAVYGSFLLSSTSVASGVPWPTSLSGLSLQFGSGMHAPIYYASGGQVNIQVPWELAGQTQASLTATVNGQTSAPQTVNLASFAPGIFSMNGQGTGQGAILDPSYKLVDNSNPATAGSTYIQIYCTGLGPVTNQPSTGSAAPTNPPATTTAVPSVTVGGVPAVVSFSGLAPGTVGLYQVNAQVPAATSPGNAVPVVMSIGQAMSNTVTVAIKSAGSSPQPDPDARANALVAQMTQAEKIQLVHGTGGTFAAGTHRGAAGWVPGIPRLGIPDLYLADGSVGVGNNVGQATALPSSIASAASWDLSEAYKYGEMIGSELRAYGINVNLGGNVNLIGREPRDGRTFETKGEDPILAGKITAAHIRAIQDQHILGGVKHFALNDQETSRQTVNVDIDERSARESDLLAFEIALKDSNVQSVMCAYNLVNGEYSCENPHLLNDILKGDWGFKGFVMSDWGATHSTQFAALSGLDQEQPTSQFFGSLAASIQNGAVPQSRLDDMVHRILRAMYEVGLFDYPTATTPIDMAAHGDIAQEVEEQGAVLLKNVSGQLPLAASINSIAVIGSNADVAVLSGGGSAQVVPWGDSALPKVNPSLPGWAPVIWDRSSPLQAIKARVPNTKFDPGTNLATARTLAASSDVAIIFVSEWESEGMDLPCLNFTDVIYTHPPSCPLDQDALVAAVTAVNPHTIVVMENGGAQVMPWLDSVSAVLEAWYPGIRGGEAIANLLFGSVNPSGKLPITFPARIADLPHPVITTQIGRAHV